MKRVLALLFLAACVDPRAYTEPPPITNHVDDWRDQVIYQVMVDRFANGDRNNDFNVSSDPALLNRYQGGDWQGLADNVEYLQALGVTAVWISPVVKNVESDAGVYSYHGYWTQDFTATNPHFGDTVALRDLVDTLHEHDIVVIVDIVTNHIGQLFYYDINRNGQPDTTVYGAGSQDSEEEFWEDPIEIVTEWDPAYDPEGIQAWTSLGPSGAAPITWVSQPEINRMPPMPSSFQNDDWYNRRGRVTNWNDLDQVVHGDFPGGLKDLDTANPDVRDALIDVFADWVEATNIDGFRIDTVKHVEHGFWSQFCPAVRDRCEEIGKENFLMFGEVFDGDDALVGSYTAEDELDSVFYFPHKFQVFDDVFKRGGPTSKIEELFAQRQEHYGLVEQEGGIGLPPRDVPVLFLDNHDVPRFLYDAPDEEALKAALAYLLTADGIPCIYYGTEQGFDGGNDPANREPLWLSGYATDGALFQHISALTALRKEREALRRGTFEIRWASDRVADEEDAHVVAFERVSEDDRVLVVVNTAGAGSAHTSFGGDDMPVEFDPGTRLRVLFPVDDDREFTVAGDGTIRVEVGPYEAIVLGE